MQTHYQQTAEPDLRRETRLKIFQPAEMEDGGDAMRVHLLNISGGGALVYGEAPPDLGATVRLSCGVPLGEARVAWRAGRRFGVAFLQPLGATTLALVLDQQAAMIRVVAERMAGVE
jgi:hypothetical protein